MDTNRARELAGLEPLNEARAKATPNNPAWMTNAPSAKMTKLESLKLPDPVARALASKLTNGEINDLMQAMQHEGK